jgi:lipid II:glycine glycyltransferase (peptidoglycan interpeptide bridge formation enzyme)
MYKQKVYNKKNVVILDNDRVTNNLIRLDYKSLGYTNDFEKYDIIIESNDSLFDIYNGFNRNTKRNIKDALNIGVKLIKGSPKDISKAYEIFKKKVNKNLSYYENLQRVYNSNDNQMNIFFATLNPHTYLVKSKELYEKEAEKNEKIHEKIRNNHGKVDERLLNKKITSDSTLEKYKLLLNHAISLNQVYKDDIIIGTSIVIKNNHEVYFLIDGYNEEYRTIHSTHVLKWAIIKKYFNEGYRIFNLGEIYNRYYEKGNKYDGIYKYKIGFGGNIIEYPTELLLVINKPVYAIYSKLKKKS